MPFTITPVADRTGLATRPDADALEWAGIAADGNTLRWSRVRSSRKRCWCGIVDRDKFVRCTQGQSFPGHLPNDGDPIIKTNLNPGTVLRLTFDPPVGGLGLDAEPLPAAIVAGQLYRVELEIRNTAAGDSHLETAQGAVGNCTFVGVSSDSDTIDSIELRVSMLDNAGNPQPVDFAINRVELLTAVGNIV